MRMNMLRAEVLCRGKDVCRAASPTDTGANGVVVENIEKFHVPKQHER